MIQNKNIFYFLYSINIVIGDFILKALIDYFAFTLEIILLKKKIYFQTSTIVSIRDIKNYVYRIQRSRIVLCHMSTDILRRNIYVHEYT